MDNIQDIDFEPVEKNIRGHVLYFSTSQVAESLGESDSKIRFYTKEFYELFDDGDIEISNKQKRYTQQSIDKLKYFLGLKSDGLTIKQIKECCEEVEWDVNKGIVVKDSTPLHVQMIATALMEEQKKLMSEFENNLNLKMEKLLQAQAEEYSRLTENVKKEVSLAVDEVVSDRFDTYMENINNEISLTRETNEKIDKLRESMEMRKEESEKKGLFGRFFK